MIWFLPSRCYTAKKDLEAAQLFKFKARPKKMLIKLEKSEEKGAALHAMELFATCSRIDTRAARITFCP